MIKNLFLKIAVGGGGSSKSTTSTKVEIPKEFEPYLYGSSGILPDAQSLYKKGQLSPVPTKSATQLLLIRHVVVKTLEPWQPSVLQLICCIQCHVLSRCCCGTFCWNRA